MKKKKITILGLAIGLIAFGGAVQAGTSWSEYNTTVGKFNGSGYTGYQTKAYSGTYGELNSSVVGGSYTVDARMQASSGTGSWVRSVTDSDYRTLPNSVPSGIECRVQFSNDLTTPVDVQVSGKWRSN
ncbi:hypothetical protein PNH38_14410 [Anoxybacillus rupiensis]|uniref:Uncharacterized protein n=1 Tax=Anoxybacteroides rupiense TaxID=311460 RepID=A0ABT5W6U0_9BACL|nr:MULTISPECIES: hypothetical protein [Anoxybacillus]MBS2771894.1 hypothetical protein [Anoxybacillus rupiensis]MDE8565050.1 hypothetical protein [Anoxybacillus rupiensis]OQM44780.1 hypothetical protein B6A27_15095 [Anoxybacillus sp. UARK-01]QHC02803.1 hypothetical protein GRQ40_01495 [Anoxybacillus sp. PDR2]